MLCSVCSIVVYKASIKRFQMKSNGCRDVQHIGLLSTQTRRNTGKQGAKTRGTWHIFPSICKCSVGVRVADVWWPNISGSLLLISILLCADYMSPAFFHEHASRCFCLIYQLFISNNNNTLPLLTYVTQ